MYILFWRLRGQGQGCYKVICEAESPSDEGPCFWLKWTFVETWHSARISSLAGYVGLRHGVLHGSPAWLDMWDSDTAYCTDLQLGWICGTQTRHSARISSLAGYVGLRHGIVHGSPAWLDMWDSDTAYCTDLQVGFICGTLQLGWICRTQTRHSAWIFSLAGYVGLTGINPSVGNLHFIFFVNDI